MDVRLIPFPSEHCSNKPCVWYGLNAVNLKFIINHYSSCIICKWLSFVLCQNLTNVLLPRDPMPLIEHHDECKIEPDCNYTVYVETSDRSVQQIIKYELPGI